MSKYVYPAVFTQEGNTGYTISFPDLEHIYTAAEDLESGMDEAQDALALMIYQYEIDGTHFKKPSRIQDISTDENQFVTLVSADTLIYRKMFAKKAVKKTLTIPGWLDELAKSENINFSQVLQDGLIERLDLNGSTGSRTHPGTIHESALTHPYRYKKNLHHPDIDEKPEEVIEQSKI